MELSVIIPALNEKERIGHAIASAFRLGADEVIVADGGSSDATCGRARTAGARVVSAAKGRGTQLNVGASSAQGDILLFLHADAVLPPVTKDCLSDALHRGVAGYFRLAYDDNAPAVRLVALFANLRAQLHQLPYGDQAMFLRRNTYAALGGFRPVPFLEDLEFVLRLRRLGSLIEIPAPVTVAARRLLGKTPLSPVLKSLRNVSIAGLFVAGVSPQRLLRYYR